MSLSACQTTKTKTEYVNVFRTEYIYPSEALLTPCPAQEDLSFTTNGEMLMSLIDLSTKYAVCSARMSAIIQYVDTMKAMNMDKTDEDGTDGAQSNGETEQTSTGNTE